MTETAVAYVGAQVFDGHDRHNDSALVVTDGRVDRVCPMKELPPDLPRFSLNGGLLAPGLVDLQVNGGGGKMLNGDPTPQAVRTICTAHARQGTTSILPTLITDQPAVEAAAVSAVMSVLSDPNVGAIGMHLEGPHLSTTRKGAHDPALICGMSDAKCDELVELAGTFPSLLLTVAPESVSPQQIERLTHAGAVVSVGHTDCSYAVAKTAADHGATCVTHLFNAMSQLTNREAGLVGAALDIGRLNAGLIADGFHVDPASLRIALRAKQGPGRIFLVSDAMATVGSNITEFLLNGRKILRDGGRLTLEDGTLAGADIDLISSVRFLVHQIGLDADEALRMASLYPAQVLNRSAEVGSLTPHSRANFIHLDDTLLVQKVWVNGHEIA